MSKDRETMKAIHDEKFEQFLRSIDVYDGIKNGEYNCKFCNQLIKFDNIYTIFPEAGKIKFVCDRTDCVVKMGEYLKDVK